MPYFLTSEFSDLIVKKDILDFGKMIGSKKKEKSSSGFKSSFLIMKQQVQEEKKKQDKKVQSELQVREQEYEQLALKF